MSGVVTELCPTPLEKQATRSVCLRHAVRVRREVRATPTQYEFFPPTKSCLNTGMARLSDLWHKSHTAQ